MGTAPVENRPRDTSANKPERAQPKAAGNRLPPLPRPLRPLPVARPVPAPPAVSPSPAGGPTQTTAIAAPPPPPLASAASTVRKADSFVTQIVTPLPLPVAPLEAARGRSSSPRGLVERAAGEPGTAASPATEAPSAADPGSAALAPEVRAAEARPPAAGLAAPARRLRVRLRTAAIGALALVVAILVVAIGFSSEDLPRAQAAAQLARSRPLTDPRISASPAEPDDDDPPVPPGAAVEPAPGASEPAGAAAEPPRPPSVIGSAEPRSAVTPPAPRPRSRPAAPPSSRISATRESGHGKPAGRSRTRTDHPLTYDPDALFLDKR